MRSQKQVRLFGKVRSVRNAAAAKRKIVRKHMEARKAWQHNSIRTGPQSHNELPVPQSSIRKVKEPKQRTAEEIAERRRAREQRRLEKYLNRRKRTARALGKTTKEKKEEKGQSNGMLKKVPAEQKTAPKRRTVGRMNKYWTPRIKLTTYAGQQNKQILVKKDVARKEKGELQQRNMKKAAEPVDDNLNQKTTPEVENKKVISRTLTISGSKIVETETPANMISKTDGKPPEKKGQTKPETEAKKITVQLHPASDSVQHQAATVQEHRCATKNTDKIISVVGSKVEMNAAKHEPPKKKELKQEVVKGNEVKAEGSEQSQLNTDATADDLLKKHKKKRNRRPDGESRVSEKDHVVAYAHEMNEDEKSTDFTEVVGRRLKKKGHRDDQQNEKSVNEATVNAHNEQRAKQHVSDTSQLLTSQESRDVMPSSGFGIHDKIVKDSPSIYNELIAQQQLRDCDKEFNGISDTVSANVCGHTADINVAQLTGGDDSLEKLGRSKDSDKITDDMVDRGLRKKKLADYETLKKQSEQTYHRKEVDIGEEHLLGEKSEYNKLRKQMLGPHRDPARNCITRYTMEEEPYEDDLQDKRMHEAIRLASAGDANEKYSRSEPAYTENATKINCLELQNEMSVEPTRSVVVNTETIMGSVSEDNISANNLSAVHDKPTKYSPTKSLESIQESILKEKTTSMQTEQSVEHVLSDEPFYPVDVGNSVFRGSVTDELSLGTTEKNTSISKGHSKQVKLELDSNLFTDEQPRECLGSKNSVDVCECNMNHVEDTLSKEDIEAFNIEAPIESCEYAAPGESLKEDIRCFRDIVCESFAFKVSAEHSAHNEISLESAEKLRADETIASKDSEVRISVEDNIDHSPIGEYVGLVEKDDSEDAEMLISETSSKHGASFKSFQSVAYTGNIEMSRGAFGHEVLDCGTCCATGLSERSVLSDFVSDESEEDKEGVLEKGVGISVSEIGDSGRPDDTRPDQNVGHAEKFVQKENRKQLVVAEVVEHNNTVNDYICYESSKHLEKFSPKEDVTTFAIEIPCSEDYMNVRSPFLEKGKEEKVLQSETPFQHTLSNPSAVNEGVMESILKNNVDGNYGINETIDASFSSESVTVVEDFVSDGNLFPTKDFVRDSDIGDTVRKENGRSEENSPLRFTGDRVAFVCEPSANHDALHELNNPGSRVNEYAPEKHVKFADEAILKETHKKEKIVEILLKSEGQETAEEKCVVAEDNESRSAECKMRSGKKEENDISFAKNAGDVNELIKCSLGNEHGEFEILRSGTLMERNEVEEFCSGIDSKCELNSDFKVETHDDVEFGHKKGEAFIGSLDSVEVTENDNKEVGDVEISANSDMSTCTADPVFGSKNVDDAHIESKGGRSGKGKPGVQMPPFVVHSATIDVLATLVDGSSQSGEKKQVEKEQKRVEQAQANDRMDKVTAPSASDQIDISKDTSHKSKKTEDVENRGDVPAKSENVPTTETKLEKLSPNKPTMNVPKLKEEHRKTLEAGKVGSGDSATEKIPSKTLIKEASDAKMDAEKKEPVVLASERQKEKSTQPVRERVHKLLPRDIQFCVRMIEKYGDDYEGMAKDEGNIHCDTAKGIARKIRIFRESPQYDAYLKQKAEKGASAAEK